MTGAIVKNNFVENIIVINEEQIEEVQKNLNCEIIDASPYGLIIGDFRTPDGWTRNMNGEQVLLTLLEPKQYDGYTLAMKRVSEVEKQAQEASDKAIVEVLSILNGEV